MSLYDRIFKPHAYTLADGTTVEEKRSRAPLILLVLIALTVLSVRITGFDLAVLVKKGSKFFDILKAMFPPNTAYLGKSGSRCGTPSKCPSSARSSARCWRSHLPSPQPATS